MATHVDRITTAMERQITAQSWRPGERLPTVSGLATCFEVNRATVRIAIEQLVGRGLLVKRGNSWFVAE